MVDAILDELIARAREAFGGDLAAVVLFGSGAEGKLRKTSDVNVILVLRRFDAVVTVSRPQLEQLRDAGVSADRLTQVPNAWAPQAPPLDRAPWRRRPRD